MPTGPTCLPNRPACRTDLPAEPTCLPAEPTCQPNRPASRPDLPAEPPCQPNRHANRTAMPTEPPCQPNRHANRTATAAARATAAGQRYRSHHGRRPSPAARTAAVPAGRRCRSARAMTAVLRRSLPQHPGRRDGHARSVRKDRLTPNRACPRDVAPSRGRVPGLSSIRRRLHTIPPSYDAAFIRRRRRDLAPRRARAPSAPATSRHHAEIRPDEDRASGAMGDGLPQRSVDRRGPRDTMSGRLGRRRRNRRSTECALRDC
jgi:hypothetical protein